MKFKFIDSNVKSETLIEVVYLAGNKKHEMAVTFKMVLSLFPYSSSRLRSLGSAKTTTHILETIKKFHNELRN